MRKREKEIDNHILRFISGRNISAHRELFEKYLVLHLKVLTDLLETHPFSFLPILQPSLEFICAICFNSEPGLLFQRFTIFCLNLMKQVLLCVEYKPPKYIAGKPGFTSIHYFFIIITLTGNSSSFREIMKL